MTSSSSSHHLSRPREVPLFSLEGVPQADISSHPFSTQDGLGLSLLRFQRGAPCDDVVLLIHGHTMSSDMFIMPEHHNLVRSLLDHGFTDVWAVDFRMSNHHPYNFRPEPYDLDDIAAFDFPAALERIRQHVGERRIHVIAHCLGAVSFSMSLFGGAVTGISSFIANSSSLVLRVPRWSEVKLAVAPFLAERVLGMPYMSPYAGSEPGFSSGKLLAKAVSLVHHECDVPECHMLSFMWGSGFPALYQHGNMDEVSHRRCRDLYGPTGFHYYRHVRKIVRAGRAVKYDPAKPSTRHLPEDYFQHAASVRTPVLLIAGAENRVFTDSNVACFRRLEDAAPGRHSLHVFPRYGHQDIFMGRDAARDVFPHLLRFLDRQRSARPRVLAPAVKAA